MAVFCLDSCKDTCLARFVIAIVEYILYKTVRAKFVNISLLRTLSFVPIMVKMKFLPALREDPLLPSHAICHQFPISPLCTQPHWLFCFLSYVPHMLLPCNSKTDCSGMFYLHTFPWLFIKLSEWSSFQSGLSPPPCLVMLQLLHSCPVTFLYTILYYVLHSTVINDICVLLVCHLLSPLLN